MPYYPVFLDIKDRKIIIVGGGLVAERKVKNLLTYGCRIYICANNLTPYLNDLVTEKTIKRLEYNEIPEHMKEAFMAIAATDDHGVNREISLMAKESKVLINAVDQPDDCSFIVPSLVRRGELHIAISTGGKSPALAKRIRRRLESVYGEEYDIVLEIMGALRKRILASYRTQAEKKEVFEQLAEADLPEFLRKNDTEGLKKSLKSILGNEFPVDDILKKVGF